MKRFFAIAVFLLSIMLFYHYELLFAGIGIRKMPDMRMGFGTDELRATLEILRSKGQASYLKYLLVDCLFTVSFAVIQNWILKFILGLSLKLERFQWTCVFARIRAGLDLLENMIFVSLMLGPLSMWSFSCIAVEIVTNIKFLALGLWILSVGILLTAAVIYKLGREKE